MPLFGAMVFAPLVAINPRWPRVLHAVEMEEIAHAWPNGSVTSECGRSRLRVLASGSDLVLWPPRVKGLTPDHERCADCYVATGRKRPRSTFRASS